MHHFRLYFLDSHGRILRAEDYCGDDDASALAEAVRRDHADYIEIWQGTRKAGSVDPITGQLVQVRSTGQGTTARSSRQSLS
jgi:hypothetical protein